MAYVIAVQIFSRNHRNTILIGSLTQDAEKGYQDKFLCCLGAGRGGRVLLNHAHGFLLPVGARNYSRFNSLSVIDTNFYPYS